MGTNPSLDQPFRKHELRRAMEETRARTLRLLEAVPDTFFKVRVHDFYSPVGWHFGHIGMTEEFWVCGEALGLSPRDPDLTFLFANLPENPKDNRVHLPSRTEVVDYLASTRCTVLDALDGADLSDPNRLVKDGYAWEFALEHECQHQETICELLQLIHKKTLQGAWKQKDLGRERTLGSTLQQTPMKQISAGSFLMGAEGYHCYDNELQVHTVHVDAFELDVTPVTVSQWRGFQKSGYEIKSYWSPEGWEWLQSFAGWMEPEYWTLDHRGVSLGNINPMGLAKLVDEAPVLGISWYEADAYARWADKRLPTEAEWEYAARFDPQTGNSRHYSWGSENPASELASYGINGWQPDPVGSHPSGASAFGILDMSGGVWEWTSTPFMPYPGFEAFPYDGYSKDHMDGKHYVCRGGSWATNERLLRCSFRNWYVPTYRQGFLGLRCAR